MKNIYDLVDELDRNGPSFEESPFENAYRVHGFFKPPHTRGEDLDLTNDFDNNLDDDTFSLSNDGF